MTAPDHLAAARLLVTHGRWWIHGGAGPNDEDLHHGAAAVLAHPRYRAEMHRDALIRATDNGDVGLARRLNTALDTIEGAR